MNVTEAIRRLSSEPLRHVVTLKLLTLHGGQANVRFLCDAHGWALSASFPIHVSDYDTRTYRSAELMVLLEGSSLPSMLRLLDELPSREVVLKTSDQRIVSQAVTHLHGRIMRTFVSFTAAEAPRAASMADVVIGSVLDPDVARVFVEAGYAPHELGKYFQRGARWFAIRDGESVRCACFVFSNFERLWEVAGVFTRPEYRRQGLASLVVTSALRHLVSLNLQPRYQATADNSASLALARHVGLDEFLRMVHVLLPGNEVREREILPAEFTT